MKRKHPFGAVLFARRMRAACLDLGGLLPILAFPVFLLLYMSLFKLVFGALPGNTLAIFLVPLVLFAVLLGLPKIEFRERGVRMWTWRGRILTVPVDATTQVTFKLYRPEKLPWRVLGSIALAASPEGPCLFELEGVGGREKDRIFEVALHYSRPRAEVMLEEIRAGRGAYWFPGARLDSEGIRYRPAPREPREVLLYEDVRRVELEDYRFRIEGPNGTVIEGDANRPNHLAGQIAIEEMLPRSRDDSHRSGR